MKGISLYHRGISVYPTQKNAKKLEEIFHGAGLKGVKVLFNAPFFYDPVGDASNVIFQVSIAPGKRLVVRDIQPGAALVWHWGYYYSWKYYKMHDAVQLLVTADGEDTVTVRRVPWAVETVDEAKEFVKKYRFIDHFIGATREKHLKRKPFVEIC